MCHLQFLDHTLTHHTLKTLSYEPRLYLWVFQFPVEPSVCETCRSISISFQSFIAPTPTYMYSLRLSPYLLFIIKKQIIPLFECLYVSLLLCVLWILFIQVLNQKTRIYLVNSGEICIVVSFSFSFWGGNGTLKTMICRIPCKPQRQKQLPTRWTGTSERENTERNWGNV